MQQPSHTCAVRLWVRGVRVAALAPGLDELGRLSRQLADKAPHAVLDREAG